MKNEPHVIGDRVPNAHALIAELTLVSQGCGNTMPSPVTQPIRLVRLHAALGWMSRIVQQRGNRLALLELNDEQLKDIGLSRCQAYGDGYSRYRRSGTGQDRADIDRE